MPTTRWNVALLAPLLLCTTPALANPARGFDAQAYAAAVARAQSGDPGVDYTWLRIQTSARLGYAETPWTAIDQASTLIDTQPDQALHLAQERMATVWTDFTAHIIAQMAYKKLGKTADAAREGAIAGAITRSIAGGHKGTTIDDAFNAVSVAEEYRVLFLLHLQSDHQSLVSQGGENFDVFDVKDLRNGELRKVWFNVDAFFGKEFSG
jgi:hypothetical protein